MTASSIHHRPAPFIAAAAAVAAIAAGSVALSVSHHPTDSNAPTQQSLTSLRQNTPPAHRFHPTTSGGRIMLAE